MNLTGSIIVSWDFSNGRDRSVLLVGEKQPGEAVKVINAFGGKEAEELWARLMPGPVTMVSTKKGEING